MKLKWHGHSCFEITLNSGATLVTDPFDDHVGYPLCTVRADFALVSHGHGDHSYVQSLQGQPQIIDAAGVHAIPGGTVTGVPTWHDDAGGRKRGANLIFRVEADGLSIAHLGDLGHLPETDEQRAILSNLDVMLIPIGGYYTIDTPTAVEIIRRFTPRAAIAMHFRNDYCHFPVSDEAEFVRLTGAASLPNVLTLTGEFPTGCGVMAYPG